MVLEAEQRQQLQTRMSAHGVAVRGPAASRAQIILPLANGQTHEAIGVLPGVAGVTVRPLLPASGDTCRGSSGAGVETIIASPNTLLALGRCGDSRVHLVSALSGRTVISDRLQRAVARVLGTIANRPQWISRHADDAC
ncbi:MAG: hypothetical protein MUF20_12065 [Methylotetracoccus sp.]|jgi:hypothetical protein|nr:hypothetical protein [Methylotetracoccus sp.]